MAYRCPVRERFWRDMLAQFEAEDCTAREFCGRHRLVESAFHFWRRELARRDAQDSTKSPHDQRTASAAAQEGRASSNIHFSANDGAPAIFQPVAIRPSKRPSDARRTPIDLHLRGGHVLRIRKGFDEDTLRQLLNLLDSSIADGAPSERTGRGEQAC